MMDKKQPKKNQQQKRGKKKHSSFTCAKGGNGILKRRVYWKLLIPSQYPRSTKQRGRVGGKKTKKTPNATYQRKGGESEIQTNKKVLDIPKKRTIFLDVYNVQFISSVKAGEVDYFQPFQYTKLTLFYCNDTHTWAYIKKITEIFVWGLPPKKNTYKKATQQLL
ncbi:hypothetical protein RFI_20960 [Reticulomyxa filosa]|uniref:Uncharacterized protein n=1 Tax=Reticulomyxa filosa TaxID=46433 RepID=X6MSI8_RETFI|nr:hypothetical protein RFI_20960 [Reticulomyxa filosa]|eukprot:ETO16387.1 hypothetical protein RFI_20960 [Reticulomyxa filosa]